MKKMFVLLMMVFALSIGMTTSVQASGVGNDFDVGYTITQWTPAADMQHFCMDAVIPLSKIEPMTSLPATCEFYYALQLRHQAQPYKYWEGATTKASLCEAVLNTYSQYRLLFDATPYAFGRDIRRLLCEAKA